MRHILLATTGESPQVVTETLYGMHKENQPWPDAIRIITTTLGAKRAREGLLEQGHIKRLCDEIARPLPQFSETDIRIVPDAQGAPVDDARSVEDHEALADFIINQLRDLTADADTTVHASLAGGRKTMTFYLGYAMSLFGRVQDTLSHVLISKGYESHPQFWYPSADPTPLTGRDDKPLTHVDGSPMRAGDAKVTLASIPFIRQREELPSLLRNAGDAVHFRSLVRLFNLADQPEDIRLTLDFAERHINLEDARGQMRPVKLRPDRLDFAFYAMMARATLREDKSIKRPSERTPNETLLKLYLDELLPIFGLPPEERAVDALDALEDWNDNHQAIPDKTLLTLRGEKARISKDSKGHEIVNHEPVRAIGMTHTWFDARKNALKELFQTHLPSRLLERLLPRALNERGKDGKKLPYRIYLSPDSIKLD